MADGFRAEGVDRRRRVTDRRAGEAGGELSARLAGRRLAARRRAGHHIAYEIKLAPGGSTSAATIRSLDRAVALTRAGDTWLVDGVVRADLSDCPDVDLESSAVTNALPVARLGLAVGETGRAPAAWVRADLTVERLEQTYSRLDERRYDYVSHYDGFRAVLEYGADGLIVDYPGIAVCA